MSTETKRTELDALKEAADYYGTALMLITTRISYYPEEFQGISNTIQFITNLRAQVVSSIEKIEPKKTEKAAPLEMDLTHVTAEKPAVTAEFTN